MPHIVVDHERLGAMRQLLADWDDDAFEDGEWREEAAAWAELALPLLRAFADPRCELPDVHA